MKIDLKNWENDPSTDGKSLKIYTVPSPILRKTAAPVTQFDKNLKNIVKDMLYTMYKAPGIGLAAPQIGLSQRFFVLDVDYNREKIIDSHGVESFALDSFNPRVYINPVIKSSDGTTLYQEGCLSVPGIFEDVERFDTITLHYQDWDGNPCIENADELLSICIQHELDHLDGIIFLDRLNDIKKNLYLKKLQKIKKQQRQSK